MCSIHLIPYGRRGGCRGRRERREPLCGERPRDLPFRPCHGSRTSRAGSPEKRASSSSSMSPALARMPDPPRRFQPRRRRNGCSRGLSRRGAHPPFRDVRARRRLRDPGHENVASFTRLPAVRTRPNATATSPCRRCRRGDRQGDADRPAPDDYELGGPAHLHLQSASSKCLHGIWTESQFWFPSR
jgi:hypothetical protein